MFGNTTSFRVALGSPVLPVVAPGTIDSSLTIPVPGIAPGDVALVGTVLNGVPVSIQGSCAVAGTLVLNVANTNAGPSAGGAVALGEATILRHTGSV
jgi:hypothetical protein